MATSSAFPDFAEFLAEVASITAELLRADRVDLRSIDVLPRSEQYVVGSACIQSGHMEVGHDVPRFIEGLLTSRDRPLTAAELDALRDALGTFLHESIHLALPNGYNPGLALHSLEVPSEVFLEEGVTEAATHALLPQLLARLERVFPGVSREVPDLSGYYPNYVPAAHSDQMVQSFRVIWPTTGAGVAKRRRGGGQWFPVKPPLSSQRLSASV